MAVCRSESVQSRSMAMKNIPASVKPSVYPILSSKNPETMRRASLIFILAFVLTGCTADFWLTPDQRGQMAMERGEYAAAAGLFTGFFSKGVALFRAGEFEAAAAAFSRTNSAESHYNRGNSLVMMGRYKDAVAAYNRTIDLRPDWKEALANRKIATLRAERLALEGGDMTGGMLGADEIVFGEGGKDRAGKEDTIEADSGQRLTDEELRSLWLRNVQTKPADFLRAKFAYQLADRE